MRSMALLGFLLVASPALAQKVTVDYAKDVDFGQIKTFQYVETKETDATNPLMADRIVKALKAQLGEGGLREVQSGPDISVTYHLTTQQNQVLNTTGFGYGGVGPGWGGWGPGVGMGGATTTETTYTEGTLVFDAYRAEDQKMIWRGTGTVTVKSKPDKQMQQVENILQKLGAKWQKILANAGK